MGRDGSGRDKEKKTTSSQRRICTPFTKQSESRTQSLMNCFFTGFYKLDCFFTATPTRTHTQIRKHLLALEGLNAGDWLIGSSVGPCCLELAREADGTHTAQHLSCYLW